MANKPNQSAGNILLKILIVLLLVAGLAAASFLLGQKQIFKNEASVPKIKLLVIPQDSKLPSQTNIYITSPTNKNKRVVFAKVVARFDNTQIKLTSDPKAGNDFKNTISLTTASEANSTGQIIAVLGRDPGESSGQNSSTLHFLQLNFETQPDVFLSENGTILSIGSNDSHAVSLPKNRQNLDLIQSKLTSDKTKIQEEADLGLKLKVSQDSNGKKYISASWNSISDQNFESFVLAVRDASTQNLVTGSRDADLKDTTIDLTNLPTLSSGSYYVNLRAKYTQKTVIQFPKKYFTVQSSGNVIVN